MEYQLDVHTHTLASGHAYNTIMEMAQAAHHKGLKLLGITEHAPMLPGSCDEIYFRNLHVVPRQIHGVELMLGAEVNILDFDGRFDLDKLTLDRIDLRIASMHSLCIKPYVDIIGHPDDGIYPLDYEAIVEAAKEHNVLLEVNNNSLNPAGARKHTKENIITMLELCKSYGQPVIMNSDAHVFSDVARRDFSEPLMKELGFPEELIVNRSVEVFKSYLGQKRR